MVDIPSNNLRIFLEYLDTLELPQEKEEYLLLLKTLDYLQVQGRIFDLALKDIKAYFDLLGIKDHSSYKILDILRSLKIPITSHPKKKLISINR